MKFSIITPTHSISNVPFLTELYLSIENQKYTDWEWIIVLNGNIQQYHLPETIRNSEKIFIHYLDTSANKNIGYVKNVAASYATGDILVEIDHDDMITPDCLQELYKAFRDRSVGFVYSNDAIYHMKDEFIPYDPAYGWTYKKINWQNKELFVMNTFEPSSQSLSFIWYAPDHVRAWRKSVYDSIGGHNINLDICDDHELMIRTYLNTKFVKIDKPLYIYRVTGDNTSINHKNAEIQVKTREIFNHYAYLLAEKDARDKGLMLIDLGGGINKREGYTSIDRYDADILADLNDGIPLPTNSVGVIYASHVLEHLKDPIKSMSEIHRVLVHGGWAFIEVPSTDGRGAFQDPTHVSFWNENSFLYYTDRYLAQFIRNKTIRFSKYRCETLFPNEWMKNLNVCVTIAWLVAIKDDTKRFPGIWKI